MKRPISLSGLRSVFHREEHGKQRRDRKVGSRKSLRRATFEQLEDRLVFAVQLTIAPLSALESAGAVSAMVTRTGSLAQALTVNLTSSDTSEATVPATVQIPANQSSANFNISVVNDTLLDDQVTVTITASAISHSDGVDTLAIVNDDFATLRTAPASDTLVLTPAALAGFYDVTTGPNPSSVTATARTAAFSDTSDYQTVGANVVAHSTTFFDVDITKTYALAGWAKSGDELGQRFFSGNLQSFGYASYDADYLPILPEHVLKHTGAADTTLAMALNPGDTVIRLTNAAGWSNSGVLPAATRGIAWYGYQNSDGTTYADYTYTRNVALGGAGGLWAPGAVSGNTITLAAPWNGPALAAGTAIRNTGTGEEVDWAALDSASVSGDWTWKQHAAVFGGEAFGGGADTGHQFRPGTAYIKPMIRANEHGTASNFVQWRDVTITEVAAGTSTGALAPPVVDLSGPMVGDQRQALDVPMGTPYSWSTEVIKVNTSQTYTLSGRSINVSKEDERPLGFASLDVDRKLIHPLHVTKFATATDTTLAAALKPGDTSFLVTNASGWSNAAWDSAETRALAWYGYSDSTGHTYANYTYTRNVAYDLDHGLWDAGEIRYDAEAGAYRIELRAPWSGPQIAAGAAIRNASSGRLYNQPEAGLPFTTLDRQAEYSSTFGGGVWQGGSVSDLEFRPGTVYIQPVFATRARWDDVVIGPAGAATPTKTLEETADHRVVVDLDVLGKGAFGGVATVVIESVGAPQNGTATLLAGAGPGGRTVIQYRSEPWFVGTDAVIYTLRNTANNATQTFTTALQVLGSDYFQSAPTVAALNSQFNDPNNVAPNARFDVSYTTYSGATLEVDGVRNVGLLSQATDGTNVLVVRLVAGPSHGKLDLNYDGTFQYVPNGSFVGADTFRYEVFDGEFSATAVASISVRASADAVLLERLRSIGLAMDNYESSVKRLPFGSTNSDYYDANGNPHLSWRVHILPYLGYQSLFNEFHLNEPWNSAHNLPLASKMPDFFRQPSDATNSTTTTFQTVSGEGEPYYWRRVSGRLVGPRYVEITDGVDNTLMVANLGSNKAITWTKPDGLTFDANNPLASLGTLNSGLFYGVLADGSTITLSSSISADTFKSLVTVSGGEIVDADTLRRQFAEKNGGVTAVQSFGASKIDTYFKQIALALHYFVDSVKSFPPGTSPTSSGLYDENGIPHLSWRVRILPFLGYQELYDRFNLQEPWDSPTNLPLLAEMPDIFRSSGDPSDSTSTRILALSGQGMPGVGFYSNAAGRIVGSGFAQISDGTSQTIMFLEAGADKAVPWTKWEDLPFDLNAPLESIGDVSSGVIRAALFDGSLMRIPADISPASLRALATRNGREPFDAGNVQAREAARAGKLSALGSRISDLKNLVLGMSTFADNRTRLPSSSFASDGTPLLSWRVHILPYIEQQVLYDQFRKNEPWDSPHNLALLQYMPDIFRSVGDPADSVTTRVQGFTGPGAPFPAAGTNTTTGLRYNQISDGTSNTIAFTEVGADHAVPWSKPSDMPYNGNNPFSALGDLGSVLLTAMFDGSVQTRSATMTADLLKALITYNGAESVTSPPALATVPGVFVYQTGGNTKANEFGADVFDVVLDKAPLTSVVLSVGVSNAAAAALDKATLTFTPDNWNVPQRVVFRPMDNQIPEFDQTVDVTVAVVDAPSDSAYDDVATQSFAAKIIDDDARPTLAGDFNGDGSVDAADYTKWQDTLSATGLTRFAGADGDGDGAVTQADYTVWRSNFGARVLPRPVIAGDFNSDGKVDAADYTVWADSKGVTGRPYFSGADATGNGKVTELDLHVWRSNFGASSAAATGAAAVGAADEVEDSAAVSADVPPTRPTAVAQETAFAVIERSDLVTRPLRSRGLAAPIPSISVSSSLLLSIIKSQSVVRASVDSNKIASRVDAAFADDLDERESCGGRLSDWVQSVD